MNFIERKVFFKKNTKSEVSKGFGFSSSLILWLIEGSIKFNKLAKFEEDVKLGGSFWIVEVLFFNLLILLRSSLAGDVGLSNELSGVGEDNNKRESLMKNK